MHYLLIHDKKKQGHQFHPLKKEITTFGHGPDYDVNMPQGLSTSFMVVTEGQGLSLIAMNEKIKNLKGPWKTPLTESSFFELDDYKLALLYNLAPTELPLTEIPDWNFQELPKNIKAKDYPQKILHFILKNLHLSEGSLFIKQAEALTELSAQGLKLTDKTIFHLNDLLQTPEASVIMVNPLEHSALFNTAPQEERSFLLVRTPLDEKQELILYLPQAQSKTLPQGILKTLLFLVSQSLYAHLSHLYNERLKNTAKKDSSPFFGKSEKMKHLDELAKKLAPTDLSLLILGETGVGKEVLAKHLAKLAGNKKLVSVNCAAIPKELAESILFGHKKGSFTHAISDQIGKIQEASFGILFLDEVGELPLELQAKLLRVLQEKTVCPIGGRDERAHFRLICATHQNLPELIAKGKFREDFYYRINEASLHIPALRDRPEEIPLLAMEFIQEVLEQNEIEEKTLSQNCHHFFTRYPFPGNIRELKSLVRKLVFLLDKKVIEAKDFEQMTGGERKNQDGGGELYPLDLKSAKKMFYQQQLGRALQEANSNKAQAAELLGISQRTLFRLLAENALENTQDSFEQSWQ